MPTTQLMSHEVFQYLRPDQINAISSAAEEITLNAGAFVFRSGEPAEDFFVVLEGEVRLRLPRPDGRSTLIDEVSQGAVFGSCVCFQIDTYLLNAQCTQDTRLLQINARSLKRLMDADLVMGYAVQSLISRVYFRRYVETMGKF